MPGLLTPPGEIQTLDESSDLALDLLVLLRDQNQDIQRRVETILEALREREVWLRNPNETEYINTADFFFRRMSEAVFRVERVIVGFPVSENEDRYDNAVTFGS
ncbi:hypothetical protein BD770DRAFT_411582 [Pilaira anomala]|nr:hypothetical protein BD770DRAFT_411582 [Pilaira anomala]